MGWFRRRAAPLGAGSDHPIAPWLPPGARGRRHSDDDAVGARLGGRAPAEGRVIRTPRREPIDLRAHNAPDKLGRALWQFERTEQDTRGPQLQFGAAAVEHRQDAVRMRTGDFAVRDLYAFERQAGPRAAIRLHHKRAAVLFDHLNGLARSEGGSEPDDRLRGRVDPAREIRHEIRVAGHRTPRSAGVSSMSSCQVKMRYGSVPLSSRKITASVVMRWPLSNAMRAVTRSDLLPCVFANVCPAPSIPSRACAACSFCGAEARCTRIA